MEIKVLVIGDAMLDTYKMGSADRVNPEAPTVIVKLDHEEYKLGGCANVANNVTSFGIRPTLVTAIGKDDTGKRLAELIRNNHIISSYIDTPVTTEKTRVVARGQQIVRVDKEKEVPVENLVKHFSRVKSLIRRHDCVIISDYNKGMLPLSFCVDVITTCKEQNVPVFVDPKGSSFTKYGNSTLIKPNLKEFEHIYGPSATDEELISKMQKAQKDLCVKYVVVTLGARGMIMVAEDNIFRSNEHQFEVVDITGGGDTVLATLAVMLTHGISEQEAINAANDMAGIVVRKAGTAIVLKNDVKDMWLASYITRE